MEVVRERLEREYDLDLISTAPSVEYEVLKTDGEILKCDNPSQLPFQMKLMRLESLLSV